MAWSYEQLFNTLSTADLTGQDSWSGDTAFDVVTTGTPYEGAKHVSVVHDADSTIAISRSVTGVSAGVIYFSVKINRTAGTVRGSFQIYSGATLVGRIFAFYTGASNRIQMLTNDAATWIDLNASISNNTYYRVGVEYDHANQPNKYRANINNGAFTSWYGMSGTPSWTNIDKIQLTHDGNNASGSGTIFFDAISPNYALGGPGGDNFMMGANF
jgi:hypothetical protein